MTPAEAIVTAAARAFGVRGPDILGESKSSSIAAARQTAAWLMRTHAHMSFPEIARAIDYADHSSAMSAYRQACDKLDVDAHFTRCLRSAEASLLVAGGA